MYDHWQLSGRGEGLGGRLFSAFVPIVYNMLHGARTVRCRNNLPVSLTPASFCNIDTTNDYSWRY
jgi:hypothetical protein